MKAFAYLLLVIGFLVIGVGIVALEVDVALSGLLPVAAAWIILAIVRVVSLLEVSNHISPV